ncbi:MAG: tetratricopeptide repeat protein [Limisphaerales bacterium]
MLTILKKSPLKIYLCGLSVAIAIVCGCANPQEKALSRGNALLKQGRYAEAVAVFKELTTALPNEARVWNLLGIAYHQSGDLVAAAHSYTTALKLSNNFYVVHYNLGCALFEAQNYLQASREFASYVMYEPRTAAGWTKLGSSQLFIRQYDLAEKSFRTALNLDPNSYQAHNGLGIALIYNKRWQDAFQAFSNALKLKPDYPPANLNMGILLLQYNKDRSNALTMFKRFLMLRPNHLYSSSVSNLVYKIEHQPQRSTNQTGQIQSLQPIVSTTNPAQEESISTTKSTSQKNETFHPVQAELPQVKTSTPTSVVQKPVINQQSSDLQKEPSQPTPQQTARSAKTNQFKPSAQHQIVSNQQTNQPSQQEQPTQSTFNPKTQPPAQPEKSETKLASGIAPPEDKTNNQYVLPAAPQQLKQTAQTQPQPSVQKESQSPKKSLLERLNPFKKKTVAQSLVTPLPPISEQPPQQSYQQSVTQKTETNHIETKTETPPIQSKPKPTQIAKVESPPQFPRYRYLNPQKPTQGERSAALNQFEAALKAHDSGNLAAAKEQYEAAVKSDPSFYEANYNLAVVLSELGELNQALVYYENALAINPNSKNARFNFAVALQKGNFIYDAANEFEKYLTINPEDTRARLLLANIYAQQLKDKTNAAKHYMEVLKFEPDNPQALAITEWLKQNFPK